MWLDFDTLLEICFHFNHSQRLTKYTSTILLAWQEGWHDLTTCFILRHCSEFLFKSVLDLNNKVLQHTSLCYLAKRGHLFRLSRSWRPSWLKNWSSRMLIMHRCQLSIRLLDSTLFMRCHQVDDVKVTPYCFSDAVLFSWQCLRLKLWNFYRVLMRCFLMFQHSRLWILACSQLSVSWSPHQFNILTASEFDRIFQITWAEMVADTD